ncbi:MAG: ethylbenzene dehydrogenase-related protein [Candidatus Omnitrophota bacterium]
MQRRIIIIAVLTWLSCGLSVHCYAKQDIIAQKVDIPPVVNGQADDAAWEKAQAVITHDKIEDIDLTLKAVYTDREIFFLVTFSDPTESRRHKTWVWDKELAVYKAGLTREDTFILKWNMLDKPVDLSVYADEPYVADIWFWKACRTDPGGFADDKKQVLSFSKLAKSTEIKSVSGKTMYLLRVGDDGEPAYTNTLFDEFKGDNLPHFANQTPTGSRADIRARGIWKAGIWTIEFSRALSTGNDDDIQLSPDKKYQFGVSRHEIAGRKPDPEAEQPLYGVGDIFEELTLRFGLSFNE